MRFISSIIPLLALLATAASAATCSTPGQCIHLNTIYSNAPSGRPGNYFNNLQFEVWEDNADSSEVALCRADWDYRTPAGRPQGYIICNTTAWSWYVPSYESFKVFDLEVRHDFQDQNNTWHEKYARLNLNSETASCGGSAVGAAGCTWGPVDAAVYNETTSSWY
ncbi:uncharacterized protein K452DRAFT_361905 [Aplosporella prunicola CBS 121167]|uniref:AA1-like domain-containing protein n=1 Tax=Aplosporella prunicola CBS 121167 TaxID=1176127 RepID=A0A6A6B263_9PEZI|nr:uncharacterized protein K452DRAFT_361905 [Aplosporella prunicola CBS 121167]KAF2137355.1 hypothetical protein K452DRAFT_361905 [Aplosporella prunicola CBS 121167]